MPVTNGRGPAMDIKVKALGLHWRDGRLLAAEVRDEHGRVKGVRPLGGGVDFGERCEAAVRREFKEELGVDVDIVGGPLVIESLFTDAGANGHEIVFVFEVRFPATEVHERDHIVFHESDGKADVARWYDLDELDRDGYPALYPEGLKSALTTSRATD